MNQTELRQTNFAAVPLRNVVGIGSVTAYQISVTRGRVLATIGSLEEFVNDSPANASRFEGNQPEPASVTPMRSWFRRVMAR